MKRLLLVHALALLAAAWSAAPAHALPPAGAYPSREIALAKPSADEARVQQLFDRLRAQANLPPMTWNGSMSAVAREHSEDMAANNYCDYYSPALGTLDYRLHRAGVSSANARYAVFSANSIEALEEPLRKNGFAVTEGTQVGIGVISTGMANRQYFVTFITRVVYTTLDPFPTLPLYGKAYRLSGTIAPGLTHLALVATPPDGKILEVPLTVDANRRFSTTFQFNRGAGLYTVELTATGKLGPMVLDLMHCYAGNGRDYPPPDPADKPVQTGSDMRQAEHILFQMINRSRAEAALPPLKLDARLSAVARAHSEDMRRNNFFAHVSPTQGDLAARVARAGIKARRFTENIAINPELVAAHRSLMDSPGHRKNLLDPDVTAVGLGIVMGEPRTLFITENFLQEFASYNTARLAENLLQEINALRAQERLPALKPNDALRRIAELNSAWMVEQGKPGYDKAKSELDKARLGNLTSFQMAAAQSTEPPTPELLGDQIKKNFQQIGIGIVQVNDPGGEKLLYTTVLLGAQ